MLLPAAYFLYLDGNTTEIEGREKMRQHLFSGAWTFDSSGACLHPLTFFLLEDLLLATRRYEANSAFVVSHSSVSAFNGIYAYLGEWPRMVVKGRPSRLTR